MKKRVPSSRRDFVRDKATFEYESLEPRKMLAANLVVTEIVASNVATLEDGYGNTPDWIELHNSGDAPIDLLGHKLTDDASDISKWSFTSSHLMQPGDYLVVFASDMNEIDPAGNFHTNFKLSANGEYVGLYSPLGDLLSEIGSSETDFPQQITDISYGVAQGSLLNANSISQYLVPTNGSLGTAWTANNFDATVNGFATGRSAIGYETNPGSNTSYSNEILTEVPAGTVSTYVRVQFEVDDPSSVDDLTLSLKYDDGFGVYLNGTFVFSENADNGLNWDSTASSFHDDNQALQFSDYGLDGSAGSVGNFLSLLQTGTNTLAIHALNSGSGSSDYLIVPKLVSNSAGGAVSYLESPTPGQPNSGVAVLGPSIESVTPNGTAISPGQALTVTANVSQFDRPVDTSSVRLNYRVNYGSRTIFVMNDEGTGSDAVAGDGIYSATIPGAAMTAGSMVRWYVTADDIDGNETRAPRFFDPLNSAEYYGTVVTDASIDTDLPVLHWFVINTNTVNTDAGSRGSLYYNGEFYDNIQMDIHGQSTRLPEFPKKSYDFDANSGEKFLLTPDGERASDFNLLTNFADQTKVRHPLAYEVMRDSGVPAHLAFSVVVHRNGSYYGMFDIVEEGDEEYLERIGLDPNGALYKVDNPLNHAYNNVAKRSRNWEDHSDFQEVVNANNLSGTSARIWDYDNLDIANLVNYMASQIVVSNLDFGAKNYYMYHDNDGTGLWSPLPWDSDLSFGHQWTQSVTPPYFDNTLYTSSWLMPGWNDLFQRMYSEPRIGQMVWRRVVTLSDQYYGTQSTPVQDSWLYQRLEELRLQNADEVVDDFNAWGANSNFTSAYPFNVSQAVDQLQNVFINARRNHVNNDSRTPSSQVGNPDIGFGDFDANPISGLQAEEFVELTNSLGTAVDISGWKLSGGISHTFKPGTVVPAGSSLYVVKDIVAFKNRSTGPQGGQQRFIQGNYDGQLGSNEDVNLIAADGELMAAFTTPDTGLTENQQHLRVVEVNYHPLQNEDAEYIEFLNTSSATTLNLTGVSITDGPSDPYVFPTGTTLNAGERLLVVKDPAIFALTFPNVDPAIVYGGYNGKLSNSGEKIRVAEAGGEAVFDFTYGDSDPWSIAADGAGGTLQLVDEFNTPLDLMDKFYRWRGSYRQGGTPGEAPSNPNQSVVINEVLAHSVDPQLDFIELHNFGSGAIDIGGWYLSDDKDDLYQYQIPANSVVDAGGYIVFDESDFNTGASAFGLSSLGESVWLTSVVGSDVAFVDYVDFGATFASQSIGRVPDATGRWAPQLTKTIGAVNSGAYVGPVTITEVNYHPANPTAADLAIEASLIDNDLEFVEIHNAALTPVNLENWRLRGIVDYDFAPMSLGAESTLLIVSFNPLDPLNANRLAAFRNHYGIDSSVEIVGGYSDQLSNNYGRVELQSPDDPGDGGNGIPFVMVDEVLYDDRGLWPDADGNGETLQRVDATEAGNLVESWIGATPTPGSVDFTNVVPILNVVSPEMNVVEGNSGTSSVQFVVALTQPGTTAVSVDFATIAFEGGAIPGVDFVVSSGTLTFLPGEVSKTVSFDVIADQFAEVNEQFGLEITNISGGSLALSTGVATIEDDDNFELGTRIDFGTPDSAVFANSIGFTDTSYSAELGMGWTSAAGLVLNEGRRGDALTRDRVIVRNASFAIDIANGDYIVSTIIGVTGRRDPFDIIFEGITYETLLPRGPYLIVDTPVTVADGQLNFGIAGGGGLDNTARFSGLLVQPAQSRSSGGDDTGRSINRSEGVADVSPLTWTSSFGASKSFSATAIDARAHSAQTLWRDSNSRMDSLMLAEAYKQNQIRDEFASRFLKEIDLDLVNDKLDSLELVDRIADQFKSKK